MHAVRSSKNDFRTDQRPGTVPGRGNNSAYSRETGLRFASDDRLTGLFNTDAGLTPVSLATHQTDQQADQTD